MTDALVLRLLVHVLAEDHDAFGQSESLVVNLTPMDDSCIKFQ